MKTSAPRRKGFWLLKTEPDVFSIDDLERERMTTWDGVRNYQARNFIRDEMAVGDEVLLYHSSTKIPGVAGLATIAGAPYPDPTAFDSTSDYFDPKSKPESPRWFTIEVGFVAKLERFVSLEELKTNRATRSMMVCRKGMMLSVQPVSKSQFAAVCRLGRADLGARKNSS